jgi:hypothetical protein
VAQPRVTHSCITLQMRERPASISASLRQARSLRRMMLAMLWCSRAQISSSCSPVVNGWGSTVESATMLFCPASPLTTKPPPTE